MPNDSLIKRGTLFNLKIYNEECPTEVKERWTWGRPDLEWEKRPFFIDHLIALDDFNLEEAYRSFWEYIAEVEEKYFEYNKPKSDLFVRYLSKKGIAIRFNIATIILKETSKIFRKKNKIEINIPDDLYRATEIVS